MSLMTTSCPKGRSSTSQSGWYESCKRGVLGQLCGYERLNRRVCGVPCLHAEPFPSRF